MRLVQRGPVAGLVGSLVLLGALAAGAGLGVGPGVGLGAVGWLVGAASAVALAAALEMGIRKGHRERLGPADWVTLLRAVLVVGVAALVADRLAAPAAVARAGGSRVAEVVGLAAVALVLDGVDGRLARHTGTASTFGARFDMEVDAILILVLSVGVARSEGPWVLALGAARYAFVAAGWMWPWMRRALPPRSWRKVVAAVQGVVLTAALAGLGPGALRAAALVVAAVLLAESFGRDVLWLWVRRSGREEVLTIRWRVVALWAVSGTVAWVALVAPDDLTRTSAAELVRVPVEGVVLAAVVLALPRRLLRPTGVLIGLLAAAVLTIKVLDTGFLIALGRPLRPVADSGYVGSATGLLGDSIGRPLAIAAMVLALAVDVALLLICARAGARAAWWLSERRPQAVRVVGGAAVVWLAAVSIGIHLPGGPPVASADAAALVGAHVRSVGSELRDRATFSRQLHADPFGTQTGPALLRGLAGHDVMVVFVESYGRVAIEDPVLGPSVDATVRADQQRLAVAGWQGRSAFLASPTFGGLSWLAHSTLQSGLWVDSQERYDTLLHSQRLTLTAAFGRAGWRTVDIVPSNREPWPQGPSFYRFDQLYDVAHLGYAGPKFGYAPMPDQYTLAAFQRAELDRPHRSPVMAELDLVSSHSPWAPLPHEVPWDQVGDGSVYAGMPAQGASAASVWTSPSRVRAAYAQSVQYTLDTLTSFVASAHDPNLVLVVLGDHQPATIVSGRGAGHDVPITVLAHDPRILARLDPWHWETGMLPSPQAPVWGMDAFRDRFLRAYAARL